MPTRSDDHGKASKAKYGGGGRRAYTSTSRAIEGPGVYATCNRGKEGRCVAEMYDLLDEAISAIYPVVEGKQASAATDGTPPGDESIFGSTKDVTPQFIEDAIALELELLSLSNTSKESSSGSGKKQGRHRVLSVDTATDCLVYMSLAPEFDPVELVHWIVDRTVAGEAPGSRHILRLEPVVATCHALTLSDVESVSFGVIKAAFSKYAQAKSSTAFTFAIEPSVRNHVAPLSRQELLRLIGDCVRKFCTTDQRQLDVRASLSNPDLVVLPTVLRNVFGISVVDGALWKNPSCRKFNLGFSTTGKA